MGSFDLQHWARIGAMNGQMQSFVAYATKGCRFTESIRQKKISRFEPLNQGVHSFGVPALALAGLSNDPHRSPDRLQPGLQAEDVHGGESGGPARI
jgi:hypothetical protein